LVLLVLALRSGLALVDALDEVRSCSTGRVRTDLAAVVAAIRWGRPMAEAWGFASPAWLPVARAWQVADTTGAGPAVLLADTADRLRERHEREVERRAARAGVLLVLPLGLAFLPAFALTAVVPVVLALAGGLRSA
jgi:Flp pilus assembly protein TadB